MITYFPRQIHRNKNTEDMVSFIWRPIEYRTNYSNKANIIINTITKRKFGMEAINYTKDQMSCIFYDINILFLILE